MDDDGLPSLVYIYPAVTGICLKPKATPTPNLTVFLKVGATKNADFDAPSLWNGYRSGTTKPYCMSIFVKSFC